MFEFNLAEFQKWVEIGVLGFANDMARRMGEPCSFEFRIVQHKPGDSAVDRSFEDLDEAIEFGHNLSYPNEFPVELHAITRVGKNELFLAVL